ncbi:hypothetical protein, partial [Pseudomonas sp. 2822-17]|uniref:hypothetical protein n=1 Tax=Pseudomonas sp. 2822-17 TaxID=1712678 RepID=UPI00130433B3
LLNSSSTSQMDLHKCVLKVFKEFKEKEDHVFRYIENYTDISSDELKKYLFHPDIPEHLKLDEHRSRLDLLNKIQSLEQYGLSKIVRDQLTYFALEPYPTRLTEDKLEIIIWMVNETDGFQDLPQG